MTVNNYQMVATIFVLCLYILQKIDLQIESLPPLETGESTLSQINNSHICFSWFLVWDFIFKFITVITKHLETMVRVLNLLNVNNLID